LTRPYLLDVNVLLALAWPSHVHHREAQGWFARKRKSGFRSCPLTQAAFVRISSNPQFSGSVISAVDAMELLGQITGMAEHQFWPDDLTFPDAVNQAGGYIAGHRQVTDAYLAGLARAHGGILATLDRAAVALWRPTELIVSSH